MLQSLLEKGDFCWHCHTVLLLLIIKQVIQLNITNLPVLIAVLFVTGLMTVFYSLSLIFYLNRIEKN